MQRVLWDKVEYGKVGKLLNIDQETRIKKKRISSR